MPLRPGLQRCDEQEEQLGKHWLHDMTTNWIQELYRVLGLGFRVVRCGVQGLGWCAYDEKPPNITGNFQQNPKEGWGSSGGFNGLGVIMEKKMETIGIIGYILVYILGLYWAYIGVILG